MPQSKSLKSSKFDISMCVYIPWTSVDMNYNDVKLLSREQNINVFTNFMELCLTLLAPLKGNMMRERLRSS